MKDEIKDIFFTQRKLIPFLPENKSEKIKSYKILLKKIESSNKPEHIFLIGYLKELINSNKM